jgi:hypothetical protein
MQMILSRKRNIGQIAVGLLVLSAIVVAMIGGFVSLAASFLRLSVRAENRVEAFTIAESGIEYYRWHLAHAAQDFTDGTGRVGPYIHPYYDANGNQIGQFSLTIAPPSTGSTIVTITSVGMVLADTSVQKSIRARMGIPSWAQYSAAANSFIAFGPTEQIYGVVYSNAGVRVDGIAYNSVDSALATTIDPDDGTTVWAVHTNKAPGDPTPPAALPSRPDVFAGGRAISMPALDFNGLTATLASLKTIASSSGSYYPASLAQGYHMILKPNGTYDLYKVTSLLTPPSGCSNVANETNWGLWSIQNQTFIKNVPYPSSTSVVFFEDHVWVDGTTNKSITIASGRFPEQAATNSDIIVNNNILYSVSDGSVTVGLIAQGNVRMGVASVDTEEIDAAMIAKNGGTIRNFYKPQCGAGYLRTKAIFKGMQATNSRGYFAWNSPVTSGYGTQQTIYDANLLYNPPPSFPLTTNQYNLISWQEVQ